MADEIEDERALERKARKTAWTKAWRAANKEKVAAYSKKHYEKTADKRRAHGREANRKRRETDPDYDRKVAARYREAHPERAKESAKKSRLKHVEKRREQCRVWHASHPEYNKTAYAKRLALNPNMHAEQYAANRERMSATAKAWRLANPKKARDILNKSEQKRRAAKRGCAENFTLAEIRALRLKTGNRCAYCGNKEKRLTIDHITPLAKGGSNSIRNIQFLCKSCNSKKQDRDPITFAQSLGYLL